MRLPLAASALIGLFGSQPNGLPPNLQCKTFVQNPATISAVKNLVQGSASSVEKLGDDHHFSGSTSRVSWDEICNDGNLPKVLRTTLPTFLKVVTADGFSILDLSHETAQELADTSTRDLGETIDSVGGVYVKLCIKTAEDWRSTCKSMLENDNCLPKDKAQARKILKRIKGYPPDKTLCISYFGESHCQSVNDRTDAGYPERMCKLFGVDYIIKIADSVPYDIIMSECLESLLTGLAQEATNANNPNDPPIHLMTSDGTGENAIHTGQRPWQTGNSISGKQLNIELRVLNPHRDKPVSDCGASGGVLDFVRRHRIGICDYNGIEDEEHKITVLEVNRYWGHLNIKSAQDARSAAFDAVTNPDKAASTKQKTAVDNCRRASRQNIKSATDAKSAAFKSAQEAKKNLDWASRREQDANFRSGWEQFTDPNSRRIYYLNETTGESSWSTPKSLPPEWRQYMAQNSGDTYYYNQATKESSWSEPIGQCVSMKRKAPTKAPTIIDNIMSEITLMKPGSRYYIRSGNNSSGDLPDKTTLRYPVYDLKNDVHRNQIELYAKWKAVRGKDVNVKGLSLIEINSIKPRVRV